MGIFSDKADQKIPLTEALDQQPKPSPPEVVPVRGRPTNETDQAEIVDVDSELKAHARVIRSASRSIVANVLRIGEHLSDAQQLLASKRVGTFGAWCRAECNLSRSVAYRLVQVHRSFGNVPAAGTLLAGVPTRLLQDLAAVPEATAQVVEVIDAGKSLTEPLGRQILTATRSATGEVEKAGPGAAKKPDPLTILIPKMGAVIVRPLPGVSARDILVQAVRDILEREKRAAA